VAAARWVRNRTPPGAVIATHDIGAMAYFSGRRVIDTAGLADSGALPYLRDQAALLRWARRRGASYIAYFPDWYPALRASPHLERVYVAARSHLADTGFADFEVYRVLP
ncbi:MAG: hypothetical protein ACRDI2_21910, partial [Chloroflexota bacterium]